ncbi:MAG TPA: cell division protein FtsZ [Rhodospirillales bacterium]|nr:cell division protein FtsZ [Rhodospirillales bacterium]
MSINLSVPIGHATPELRPRISVIGCGGAGGNAVNNMIRAHLEGVEFIVANTDAQALAQSSCERRIQLGVTVTQGLGAGSRPDIGRIAAEEALEDIIQEIRGSNMVFIAAGMGGGTGTGAAPVIARAAREQGILTVGVVTKPFHFEGQHRMRIADQGIEELEQFVDTLIIIPNQNLFRIANERTTFADAFKMADDVLYSGVRGVTDLMVMPGLINLDFADIRAVMSEMGKAMMGTGEATGDRRALDAAEAAISNPLLDDVSMKGARGVLINITGSLDMTLFEVDEAANRIRSEVDPDAFIIFGSTFDEALEGKIRVSVVATGMDIASSAAKPVPQTAKTAGVVRSLSEARQNQVARMREGFAAEAHDQTFGAAHAAEFAPHEGRAVAEAGGGREPVFYGAADGAAQPAAGGIIAPGAVARAAAVDPRGGEMAHGGLNGGRPVEAESQRGVMANLFARVIGGGPSRPSKAETIEAEAPAPATQPRLGGVGADERLPSSQSTAEDDLLDIPAFLRRQAN